MLPRFFGPDHSASTHPKFNTNNQSGFRWKSSPEGCIKVNIDASRREWTKSAYYERQPCKVILAKGKRIGDYCILTVECLTEAIPMAIQNDMQRIII